MDLSIFKDVRKGRRITAGTLAGLVEISKRSLSRIENNKGNPSLQTMEKLCEVLNLELMIAAKH